jgi:endonuclease-3
LREDFAVHLGDKIILAVSFAAPHLTELDGIDCHGFFLSLNLIPDYSRLQGSSIPSQVTEERQLTGRLQSRVGADWKSTIARCYDGRTRKLQERIFMPRGVVPRQPARTGRQDKVKATRIAPVKTSAKQSVRAGKPPVGKAAPAAAKPAKAKGYNPIAPERVTDILKRLNELYPEVTCALTYSSAWELLVATILSAQSTDVNVNRVTPELFRKYPTVEAFAALTPEQLEPDVRSTGFFRNKSKSVVGAAKKLVAEFGGQVPDDIDKLLTLPGVARKTANVVLGSWFKKAEGVVVDTHVHRISRRLELTKENDPPKIEQDLMKIIPRDRWILFSHQIIWHGRKICFARKPSCVECPLESICHAGDKTWSTVDMHKNAKV